MPNKGVHNEDELLSRLADGDERAFNIIYNEYYRQLVYFAYKLVAELPAAEDMVTEAFVNLWKSRQKLKSKAHIKSYLLLSVKHAAVDKARSNKVHTLAHGELQYLSQKEEQNIEIALAESELIREIVREIELLPAQCGKIAGHILFDGMTTGEIAKAMNISTKNVLNQKLLAIKKVRNALLKKGLLELYIICWNFFF